MNNNNFGTSKFPFQNLNPYVLSLIIISTIFFTYQILGSLFVLLAFGEKFLEMENMSVGRVVTIISQFLLILFPVYLINYLTGNSSVKGLGIRRTGFIFYLLSIIGTVVVQPVLQYYMFLQNKALDYLPFDKTVIDAIKGFSEQLDTYTIKLVTANSLNDLLVIVVAIALTPAICEELMFRGLILNTLIKSGRIKFSIILTGLIFSIFHFHPFNIIPLFLLGVYLSIIAYYGRSILPAIVVHFLNNLISVLAVYFYGKEVVTDYEFLEGNFYSMSLFAFVSFILFVLITYFIIKEGKKKRLNEQFS